jgi:8-oxo-dGTP pyrophosphatase MutT (NUDIX family)
VLRSPAFFGHNPIASDLSMPISDYIKRLRARIGTELVQMPCAAAVIHRDGGILLQRRSDDGRWALPGGAIDPGEAPAQTIVREVYEEVGLRVRPTRLLGVFGAFPLFRHVYPNGDEVHLIVSVFECGIQGGELVCRDGEATELRYFAPEEVVRLVPKYPRELFTGGRSAPYFEWRDEWAPASS